MKTPLTKKTLLELLSGVSDDTPILFIDFTGETQENDGLLPVKSEGVVIDERGIVIDMTA